MSRYVVAPEPLGVVDTGVGFYSRPVQEGQRWVNLVLDRVFGHDDQVSVKSQWVFLRLEAALDALAVYVDNLINATLDRVGYNSQRIIRNEPPGTKLNAIGPAPFPPPSPGQASPSETSSLWRLAADKRARQLG